MPLIRFTDNIQRHVQCPPVMIDANTVAGALACYFDNNPKARSYVLDEAGHLRKHMCIFVNGKLIADRTDLSDPVDDASTIDIMQALSGG